MRNGMNKLALVVLLFLFSAMPVIAQDEEVKQTVAMSPEVGNKLLEIQTVVEEGNHAGALQQLTELRQDSDLSPYETAQIWNLTAYTYYLQEDYRQAISAYERVLAQSELPPALQQSTLKTLSQLYFTQEDYRKALETVNRLIDLVGDPSADVLMLLGQAHYQLDEYQQALEPIQQGIELYKQQGNTPRENWLLLLRAIHYEMQNYSGMVVTLKELLRYYPKDDYVLTLAGAYSELGDTKKQLALTETLYEKGLLDNPGLIANLANLYLLHENPYKAAKLLEKELEAGNLEQNVRYLRLLSQAWYQAREDQKAIPPLARAASMSGDGELYVRLAQSYLNLDRWGDAADAVRSGMERGGIKREDTARLMLGTALVNQNRLTAAKAEFERAAQDQRSAGAANQWLSFINSELRRQEVMRQVLPEEAPRERDALLEAVTETGDDQ